MFKAIRWAMAGPTKPKKGARLSCYLLDEGGGSFGIVGESHYQATIRHTMEADGRSFVPMLVREPDNPYDGNAVAVHSAHGLLGYVSRDDAPDWQPLLQALEERGYDAAACGGRVVGGEPGKPSLGVMVDAPPPQDIVIEDD